MRADEDGRLGEIVAAVRALVVEHRVPTVLDALLTSACTLTGAPQAAARVVAGEAQAGEVVHTRGGEAARTALETAPAGRVGRTLAVELDSGGQVIGRVCLLGSEAGFTAADETVVSALAEVAGVAVRNASLWSHSEQRHRLLEAVQGVTAALLDDGDSTEILEQIAAEARDLVGADLATIALPRDGDTLAIRVAVGVHAEDIDRSGFSRAESLTGEVISTGRTELIQDVASDPHTVQPVVRLGRFGPALFVPLRAHGEPFGTLMVSNLRGGRFFSATELGLVESLATQASVTVAYHQAQQAAAALRLSAERERIGKGLTESAVRRLFTAGITLEQLAMRLVDDDAAMAKRLTALADELDRSIHDIRSMVFRNDAPARSGDEPARP